MCIFIYYIRFQNSTLLYTWLHCILCACAFKLIVFFYMDECKLAVFVNTIIIVYHSTASNNKDDGGVESCWIIKSKWLVRRDFIVNEYVSTCSRTYGLTIRAERNKIIIKYERLWVDVIFFNCVDSSTYDVTLEFLNILGCLDRIEVIKSMAEPNRQYGIARHMHLKQIVWKYIIVVVNI